MAESWPITRAAKLKKKKKGMVEHRNVFWVLISNIIIKRLLTGILYSPDRLEMIENTAHSGDRK